MKKHGIDCVYLDITHKPADFIRSHFPTIYERCLKVGIDMTREQVPVVPAAHYTCGGVITDLEGRTTLEGLYAIGETAYTGLHGANRLASNSLAEGLVFAKMAHLSIEKAFRNQPCPPEAPPPWDSSGTTDAKEKILISHDWGRITPSDVGLCRHRTHQQTPEARSPANPQPAGGNRRILSSAHAIQRSAGVAKSCSGCRTDGQERPKREKRVEACITISTTRKN